LAEPPQRPGGPYQRTKLFSIKGYAIISADGAIADANAAFPAALSFEADKQYYERELDRVDAVIQGRNSYEFQSNSPRRRRLVLTRAIPALAPDPERPHAFLWNPAGASLDAACAALEIAGGTLGVIGGTYVFDLFLDIGYDSFHLSRADKVKLPGGPPVFSRIGPDHSPEAVLAQHGLEPGPVQVLDAAHAVSLVDWTRKASV
jgi:dihydrofolate reductase